jgi:hypothetical protein
LSTVGIQSDDKILVAGHTWIGNPQKAMVMRLNENGTTDRSFGTGGITKLPFAGEDVTSIAIRSDNSIVGVVPVHSDDEPPTAVFALTKNGKLDKHFGRVGIFRPA